MTDNLLEHFLATVIGKPGGRYHLRHPGRQAGGQPLGPRQPLHPEPVEGRDQ